LSTNTLKKLYVNKVTLEDLEVGFGKVTQTRGGQAVTLTKINPINLNQNGYYFGPLDSDPTIRPDGSELQQGDSYFNTIISGIRTYDGIIWRNSGGQSVDTGTSVGYGVAYTAEVSAVEDIVVTAGKNAFSVNSFTLADGATLTIEDGATYKVI